MKPASDAVKKWKVNAVNGAAFYIEGAEKTSKSQSRNAIAAKEVMKQALQASFAKDSYAKGLTSSGDDGWLTGIREKGAINFATGIGTKTAEDKYVLNSGKFDAARQAADKLPRGLRGSATNMARVQAVVTALRAVKTA